MGCWGGCLRFRAAARRAFVGGWVVAEEGWWAVRGFGGVGRVVAGAGVGVEVGVGG